MNIEKTYFVLCLPTMGQLESVITDWMTRGWLPTGGLVLRQDKFCQALYLPKAAQKSEDKL